jgi:hypothetical protein
MSSERDRRGAGSAADSGQEYNSDPQYTSGSQEYSGSGQQYSGQQYSGQQYPASGGEYQQTGQPAGGYQTASGGTYQQSQRGAGTATYQEQQPAGYQQGRPEAGYGPGYGYGPEDEERHATAAKVGARLAGVLMIISGIFGFVVGLAALLRGAFYTVSGNYYYAWNHRGWGLTELILGCVLVAAGFCLILGMLWARIVGIVVAAFNAISAFLFLPRSPVSSIVLIALNLFIIWAIVHYHQRSLMRV